MPLRFRKGMISAARNAATSHVPPFMSAAARTCLILALTVGYFVASHLAVLHRSAPAASVAVAALVILLLASIRGPHRALWRAIVAAAGASIVILVARGAPPIPLMLPPVLIPALISWTFGRTLVPGRTPLIERVARGFHAPATPSDDILNYARRVTWAWTVLLAAIALVNALLVACLYPGGLLALAGYIPRWPVTPAVFAWFSNTGTYLLIGALFAIEFAIRVWRFPDYRFRNPLHFIREARARMPNIMAAVRHG
jgi:uncharacterized membrane protein